MLSIDIEKRLDGFHLRPRFEADAEFVVLLGPSGSGKSLTLRAIAGLMRPDSGRIELDGATIFDAATRTDLPPQRRNVGYLVQDLALFPHMTVAENVGFALQRWPREEQRARVIELLELLGLQGMETRLPRSLSGGQQQRVALGRALAARPSVLLLDEPFSALDTSIRSTLRREVARLRRQLGLLALFVTHDLQEAFSLADRIAIYDAGAVLQCGPRDEVFRNPASTRVAQLIEARNIIEGVVLAQNESFLEVETPWFRARARSDAGIETGSKVAVSIRPEHVIMLRRDRDHSGPDTVLDVEIEDEVATGNSYRLFLRVMRDGRPTDCTIECDVPAHPYQVMGIAERREWRVALTLEHAVAIPVAGS